MLDVASGVGGGGRLVQTGSVKTAAGRGERPVHQMPEFHYKEVSTERGRGVRVPGS